MKLLARHSLRIVHVDDDNDFGQLSAIFLKQAGFEQPIVHCQNGIQALRYFSMIEPELAPHAILLDLHMPHMNGLEVLHWLRHDHSVPDVSVYLLTSSDDSENRRRAAADGVTGYLLKAPLFDDLIENLDHLIAISNNERLEEMNQMRDIEADFVYMGESALEMAVI
jgi:CheY-like chemotaxis protein